MPPFNRQNILVNVNDFPPVTPNVNGDTIIYDANQLSSPIVITNAGTGQSLFNGSYGLDYEFNSLVQGVGIAITYDDAGNITIAATGTAEIELQADGGLQYTSGSLGIELTPNSGLQLSSSGIGLNLATLPTAGTIAGTNLIAISQGGTTYETTLAAAVGAVASSAVTATQSQILPDSIHTTFNIGSVLPNYAGLSTIVSRVIMTVGSIWTGGSVNQAQVTDGTNILMALAENDITTTGIYEAQRSDSTTSNNSQCSISFYDATGTNLVIPTAGQMYVTIEYNIVN